MRYDVVRANQKKCSGCLIKCSKGLCSLPIFVFNGVSENSLPVQTIFSLQEWLFFSSFGICSITKAPCKPLIFKIFNNSGVFINGSEVLTAEMKGLCALGGVVSFADDTK